MKSTRFVLLAVILSTLSCASLALAQTPANIAIVSGSGQVICTQCGPSKNFYFTPFTVKVTDGSGNPVNGATVTWAIVNPTSLANINGNSDQSAVTTTTDSSGIAKALPVVPPPSVSSLFYNQAVFTATTTSGGQVTLYATNSGSVSTNGFYPFVQVNWTDSTVPSSLSGFAGSPAPSFVIKVYSLNSLGGFSGVVPNVSVRLVNSDGTTGPSDTVPSVWCSSGAGSDPYSILTDASGSATCVPVFGSRGGSGNAYVIVGSAAPSVAQPYFLQAYGLQYGTDLLPFGQSSNISLSVTGVSVGGVSPISSATQSATAGQSVSFVARVTSNTGASLQGQGVTWSATPSNAVTFSNIQQTSDANGQVSANATIAANATGAITIKATSNSNPSMAATFTVNVVVPVVISGITIASGDQQSTGIGAAFGNPLVVQVTGSNGLPATNVPVTFSVTGPATLSASSATSNAAGQASVTATAGSTAGAVSVTATAGGFSKTFSLTVIPPGPNVTASSFVNAADLQVGSISPCSLASIIASGVAPNSQILTPFSIVGPLQNTLAGDTVTFNGTPAPILAVTNAGGQQQITFQVPCEVPAGSVPVTVNVSGGTANATVMVKAASPGIFQTKMSDGVVRAVVVRQDGSFVSLTNPARRGEIVSALVTGIGPVSPSVATNALPIPGTPSAVSGQIIVGINNAGVPTISAQLVPFTVGVAQVTFQIPQNSPQTNNVVFSIGVIPPGATSAIYSGGSQIPIQ